jgi:hypothetical protein
MMKIFRTLAPVVFLMTLAVPVTAQSQPAKDIPGWSDTRWGMTLDEARKSHSEMVAASEYHHWTTDNRGKSIEQLKEELAAMDREAGDCHSSADAPTWKLADLTISGSSFRVCLQFKGERLRRVELIGPENACYSIAETLTAKYGQPAKQERGFHLWLMPTTTIRLIDSANMGDNHCKVIYRETEHNDAL